MSNTIAKVFIVINFVLSTVYLVVSGTFLSQKWDYRQMYLDQAYKYELEKRGNEDSLREAQKRVESMTKTAMEARAVAKAQSKELAELRQENAKLDAQNSQYALSLAKINAAITEINDKLEKKELRIAELESKQDQYKKEAEDAKKDKDEAENERQRMELQLSNLQGELSEKSKLLQTADKELREAKLVMRALRDAGVNLSAFAGTPKLLDGQITAVSEEVPIVMISLGSDHGVEKGYQFTVYRGSKFVARVVVEEVYKNMSAARILKDMSVEKIKKGDSVTTRIGGGTF